MQIRKFNISLMHHFRNYFVAAFVNECQRKLPPRGHGHVHGPAEGGDQQQGPGLRHIHRGAAPNVPVSFVGSVAKVFEDILTECLTERGFKKGRVLAKPVNFLIEYHIKFLGILELEESK